MTQDRVIHLIEYLSSKFGQNGGVPGLKSIDVADFTCGTFGTPACPQPPWLPFNIGEIDAAEIISQSTQRATETIPPPPQPTATAPILTNNVRGP